MHPYHLCDFHMCSYKGFIHRRRHSIHWGPSIIHVYTKTYHKQSIKRSVSTAWKVTVVFDVVTRTMNALVVTQKPPDQFQSFLKDVKKHPFNSAFNDLILRCDRFRSRTQYHDLLEPTGTLEFPGKGQGKAMVPKTHLAGSACCCSRSINSKNRKMPCFFNLCEEIVSDHVFSDGKNTKENNLQVGGHTMKYLDAQFLGSREVINIQEVKGREQLSPTLLDHRALG